MAESNPIVDNLDRPVVLEDLYRRDPQGFRAALTDALANHDSVVLDVWAARLRDVPARHDVGLFSVILIGFVAGLALRLGAYGLDATWVYARYGPLVAAVVLGVYFWRTRNRSIAMSTGLVAAAVLVIVAVVLALLPDGADWTLMAILHVPVLAWSMVGLLYLNGVPNKIGDTTQRLDFVRFTGEWALLVGLLAIGGVVLSGLSISLLNVLGESWAEWYVENVAIIGGVGIVVVAAYLYDRFGQDRMSLAGALAQVFSPLFLVLVVGYLALAIWQGSNPFVDRNFLIIFNGLLIVVLGLAVFTLVGAQARRPWPRYINLALVATTIVVDLVALSAIAYRLASFGLTPNRVVVLGFNIVVLGHLAWIAWSMLASLRRPPDDAASAALQDEAVVRYLPVYPIWAAFVIIVLPAVFTLGAG